VVFAIVAIALGGFHFAELIEKWEAGGGKREAGGERRSMLEQL
jgi:hypothetical protein